MPKIEVKNLQNEVVGTLDLSEEIFEGPVNEGLLHDAVRQYRASHRSGTHATKTRGEVQGSGKKPWRQKGTGRARVGEVRNPLWRKGGTVFGPKPRDYEYHLPKKMFRAALKSALSAKYQGGELSVVSDLDLTSHRTKPFAEALGKLGLGRKVLLVDPSDNPNLRLASGNLAEARLISSLQITPYRLLDSRHVVFTRAAIEALQDQLALEDKPTKEALEK
jgi:large subunit ribosomal protein L4